MLTVLVFVEALNISVVSQQRIHLIRLPVLLDYVEQNLQKILSYNLIMKEGFYPFHIFSVARKRRLD